VERANTARRRMGKHRAGASEIADLLGVAGHELRSPLTSLKGYAQILQRRLAKQPDRDSDTVELNKMLYQISRLEHELDVYVEAARIFNGRFRLQLEQVDLVALARRMVELQSKGAAEDVLRFEAADEELIGELVFYLPSGGVFSARSRPAAMWRTPDWVWGCTSLGRS